jgi:hypothetical protein
MRGGKKAYPIRQSYILETRLNQQLRKRRRQPLTIASLFQERGRGQGAEIRLGVGNGARQQAESGVSTHFLLHPSFAAQALHNTGWTD